MKNLTNPIAIELAKKGFQVEELNSTQVKVSLQNRSVNTMEVKFALDSECFSYTRKGQVVIVE